MASLIEYECPNCHQRQLTKVERMLRCTCGWWMSLDENETIPVKRRRIVSAVAT
ncbi:MAG: hypothetical protein ACFFDI_30575 [Promethearchaeota archaeon]